MVKGLGVSRGCFYFDVHGEVNTGKTIELAYARAVELGIDKAVVASETGLTALEAIKAFNGKMVIVVTSAAGTRVENTPIGDLSIGIPDEEILKRINDLGAPMVRGTDPFWNLGAHSPLIDTGKLGMMFYEVICGGVHVCMTAVLEATDAGHLEAGEEAVAMAGSWVGLDTVIVARAANSVDFFKGFEVLEIICKPRRAHYTWPINQVDWRGDLEKYRPFAQRVSQ
ncbi:MAG TPA: hypothetical protein VMW22_00930 [Candidatus Desulfaltia sp.]|nr:hypothetical protein [Candidatus Desulfaltia sp.]